VQTPPPVLELPRYNAGYLNNPEPRYPPGSVRLGEQGRVLLRVFVDKGGRAESVELKKSCGHHRLDRVALETVRDWRFVPAKRGDEKVASWVVVPITFTLEN
jgi:protein TonB